MALIQPQVGYGYADGSGRYCDVRPVPDWCPQQTQSAGTAVQANVVEMGDCSTLRCKLVVSAITGTLDITLQQSPDNSTWRTLGTFSQVTDAGTSYASFGGADRYVRVSAVVGTTSAAWKLDAEAV